MTHSMKVLNKTGEAIAEEIRQRIKDEIGITVSIGVSWNKIFAKFGSDYQKPDAVTVITRENYKEIVWSQPVEDLLYVGSATKKKLNAHCVYTIGQLAQYPMADLKAYLGKIGEILWSFANGMDVSEVREFDPDYNDIHHMVKGMGNSITTNRDLVTLKEVRMVLTMLSESVAARIRESGLKGKTVAIHVRNKALNSYTRQSKLKRPSNITQEINDAAYQLFLKETVNRPDFAIRSLGVRVTDLSPYNAPDQLYLFDNEASRIKKENLDKTIDWLRQRFGNNSVRRCNTLGDPLSELDIKKDNVVHPIGYFS